ncbi:MAG: exodeoxyribonuclease VII large subunit, partial [Chloroflexota bacterium]|nr:exodeoxyribonuclease VII large subunit [Chloroflexota bacterium]
LDRGHRALAARAERERAVLSGLEAGFRALGPGATLARGYAVARLEDGTIVRDPAQAPVGAPLEVVVQHGALETRVEAGTRRDPDEALR